MFHRYYDSLEYVLKGIALRMRLFVAFDSLLKLCTFFLIILLGSLLVEGAKNLFPYLPFVFYLLALLFLVLVLLQGIWRVISGLSMQQVARRLETVFPRLRDDVTNALLLFRQSERSSDAHEFSDGLVKAHIRKTSDEVSDIHPKQVVNFRRAWSSRGKFLLPLFFAFMVVFTLNSQFPTRTLTYILRPLSALPERETIISVEPTPTVVLRGTPVLIDAKAEGYIPEGFSLKLWPEKGDEIQLEMRSGPKRSGA